MGKGEYKFSETRRLGPQTQGRNSIIEPRIAKTDDWEGYQVWM